MGIKVKVVLLTILLLLALVNLIDAIYKFEQGVSRQSNLAAKSTP